MLTNGMEYPIIMSGNQVLRQLVAIDEIDGFDALTRILIQSGLHIGGEEDYSVGMSMVVTMQEILNRKINLDEYEALYQCRHAA